jgi:hypothetical protein
MIRSALFVNRLPDITGIDPNFSEPTSHPVQIKLDSNWKSGLEFVRISTPTPDRNIWWPIICGLQDLGIFWICANMSSTGYLQGEP